MKGTLQRLDTVHEKLATAIRSTNPNLFFERPSENEWSIAEVVQHLCLAEQHVLKGPEKGSSNWTSKGWLSEKADTDADHFAATGACESSESSESKQSARDG